MAIQQLTLFRDHVSDRRSAAKRSRKNRRFVPETVTCWDLWTQESTPEKEMALLFLDIRNFTPLVAKHRAYDVIHIVRKMFSNFQTIIRVHHGFIIETSGDGFYAAFGTDRNLREAVNAAVAAGMAIISALDQLNKRTFERNLQQRIEIGIGVHAGKVATGSLHLGSKDHLVVMGYAVNVASRIQTATKDFNNNFIVSSRVYAQLDSPPPSTQALAHLKGMQDPCELHLIGKPYSHNLKMADAA